MPDTSSGPPAAARRAPDRAAGDRVSAIDGREHDGADRRSTCDPPRSGRTARGRRRRRAGRRRRRRRGRARSVPTTSSRLAAREQHEQRAGHEREEVDRGAQPRLAAQHRVAQRVGAAPRGPRAAARSVAPACGRGRRRRRCSRIRPTKTADHRNDSASTTQRDRRGQQPATSTPPRAGPAMNETERLALSLLFASR